MCTNISNSDIRCRNLIFNNRFSSSTSSDVALHRQSSCPSPASLCRREGLGALPCRGTRKTSEHELKQRLAKWKSPLNDRQPSITFCAWWLGPRRHVPRLRRFTYHWEFGLRYPHLYHSCDLDRARRKARVRVVASYMYTQRRAWTLVSKKEIRSRLLGRA